MTKSSTEPLKWLSQWYVWIFPAVALGIGIWLFKGYLDKRGPEIDITFEDASSLTAEKTRVRYRGVDIGTVKSVVLSDGDKSVTAHVILQKDAAHFAVAGSKFWVVAPKVGLSGVSGLETIFEGTYIAVEPGRPDGEARAEFKGRMQSEVGAATENMSSYTLEAPSVESITPNDSVTFRGLNVGTVTSVGLNKSGQLGVVQISIHNRYIHFIRENTVFWRKIGVQAKLGLFGSSIKVNSVDSILHGGVELFTPDKPGPIAKGLTKFRLEESPPKGYEKWNPKLD